MSWWNGLDSWRRGSLLGGIGVLVCLVVVACSLIGPKGRQAAPDERAAAPVEHEDGSLPDQPGVADATRPRDRESAGDRPRPPAIRARRRAPLSVDTIAALRARIEAAEDYAARIEARRALIYPLSLAGQVELAVTELDALLDDVEQREGRARAEQVALADAGNLQRRKDHAAAIAAYRRLLDRWPDGGHAAEALFHLGTCHLERKAYAEAEKVWQRLIEEHDGSGYAAWGWRKLALAQLLQGSFDASLATLDVMAKKYADTPFGEYAEMRGGYVHMAAGRCEKARAAYRAFLAECSHSKYCRLVKRQLADLERYEVLARAGHAGK